MEKYKEGLITKVDTILLSVMAVISILIAGLDVSGLFDTSSWLASRVPALTLLCIGFIAAYLIIERRVHLSNLVSTIALQHDEILQAIEQSSKSTIRSLNGIDLNVYTSRSEFAKAFAQRIKTAQKIDDLVWGNFSGREPISGKDISAKDDYSEVVEGLLRKSNVVWRELVVFNEKRFQRTKKRVIDPGIKGLNVGYFEIEEPDIIPRISFMVIDNKEVFLFHLTNQLNLRLHIKQPDIVQYFASYYEALWDSSTKLKVGETVFSDKLDALIAKWQI